MDLQLKQFIYLSTRGYLLNIPRFNCHYEKKNPIILRLNIGQTYMLTHFVVLNNVKERNTLKKQP